MPTTTSNIKKSNITKVQVKKLPALSDITKLPNINKNNITVVPYVYKNNITTYPGVFKNTILQLPDVKKTDILKYNPYVSARYNSAFQWNKEKNPDWEEIEKKAKMTINYNDPRQLNSIPDAIVALFNPDVFEGEGNGLQRIWNSFYNFFITPIKEGEWKILGLNMFQSGLEVFDWLAQGAKARIIGGPEIDPGAYDYSDPRFKDENGRIDLSAQQAARDAAEQEAVQWALYGIEGKGRKNYEYDTGNGWLDFIMECISDPGVWASFGVLGGAKGATKGVFKEITGEVAETVVKETTETVIKTGTETYVKKAVVEFAEKTATSGLKEIAEEIGETNVKRWVKRAIIETFDAARHGKTINVAELAKSLSDIAGDKMVKKLTKKFSKEFADEFAEKVTLEVVNDLAEMVVKMSKAQADNITMKIITTIDDIDNFLFQIPFWTTTPIIPAYKSIKGILDMHNTRIMRILEPYLEQTGKSNIDIVDYDTLMKKADEVGASLVGAAEDTGVKGLKNTEIQKIVYKNTKSSLNKIQSIIKKYANIKNMTETTVHNLYEELHQYLVETFKFSEDLTVFQMFTKISDSLKNAAEDAPVFKALENMLENIVKSYNTIEEVFDVISTIKNSPISKASENIIAFAEQSAKNVADMERALKAPTESKEPNIKTLINTTEYINEDETLIANLTNRIIEPLFTSGLINRNIFETLDYKALKGYLESALHKFNKIVRDAGVKRNAVVLNVDFVESQIKEVLDFINYAEYAATNIIKSTDVADKLWHLRSSTKNAKSLKDLSLFEAVKTFTIRFQRNTLRYLNIEKEAIESLESFKSIAEAKVGSGLNTMQTVQRKIQDLLSSVSRKNLQEEIIPEIDLDTISELQENLSDILKLFEVTSFDEFTDIAKDALFPLTDTIIHTMEDLEFIINSKIINDDVIKMLQDTLLDLNKSIFTHRTSVRNALQESKYANEYLIKHFKGSHKVIASENLYDEFFDKIESIANIIQDNLQIKGPEFSVVGDGVWYALKQEQTLNALTYLTEEPISKVIHEIADGTFVHYDFLKDFTNKEYVQSLIDAAEKAGDTTTKELCLSISKACENIMKGIDSVIAYEQLINSLENSTTFSSEIKSAIHSTLNKHTIAQIKVDKIAANRTAFIDKLAKNIEDYVNAKRKAQSYKLDDFRAAKSEENFFEDLLGIPKEVWENMAHHSDADCFTTEYFAKENNIDLGKNYMIIDAETTGTIAEASELLEFSIRTSEGQTILFKRHLKEGDTAFNPSNSLLQSVYSDGTKNSNELIANYRAYYNRGYKGPQFANTIEYFDTEADLINAVVEFIHKNSYLEFNKKTKQILKGHPNNTKIVGHNIADFDIDYLIKRAKTNNEQLRYFTEDTLKKFDVIDTYKEMQLRDGIFKFDKAQKQALEKTLQPYMVLREVLDDADSTLYHSGEDFINALPKELDTGLLDLSDIFKNKTNALRNLGIEDTIDDWGPFQKQLAEARGSNIRGINKALNQIIFTKDQIMSDAFKEGLAKILKEERDRLSKLSKTALDNLYPKGNIPRFLKWTDEQIDNYVKYLNTSKALYVADDFTNTLGYKKVFDAKLVRAWFNTSTDVLDYKTGTLMFNTARALDNQSKYILNPNAILQYESVITDFLNDIKTKAIFENTGNPVFKYLNMDTGSIAEKYTLARYLYNTVQSLGLTNKLDKVKLTSMADLLEEHQLFTHHTVSDTTLTFAEHNRLFMDGETGRLGSKFNALFEDFKKTIHSFNLSNAFDDMQIFSPARQLYAKGAAKVSNLLEYVTHLAKKATTKQLYDMQSKLYFITDNLNKQTLRNVLDVESTGALLQNLAWTGGIIRFNIADAPDLYERFIKYADKLKEQGIKVTEDGQNLWLNIDRSKIKYSCDILKEEGISVKHIYVNGADITRPALKELDVKAAIAATKEEFKLSGKGMVGGILADAELDELGEYIIEARKGLITTTEGLAAGVHADVASKKTFRYIYEQAPKAVQDSFGDVDEFLDESGWFSETFFNLSNLGTISSKQMLQPGAPSHLIYTYKLNTELALKTQDTKLKYIYNMMNNDMRLDIGIWADSANDEAIIKYLKDHSDLSVAVLYKTNKGRGFDIKRIKINTIEDLNNARRLHATILTDDMYYKTASVISTSIFESGALNAVSKIIQIYKLGVLSVFNLGGIMRNFIDATLKEIISLEDVLSVPRAQHTAIKNLNKYNKTLNYLIASADLNTEAIERIAKTYGITPEDVLKDINFNVAKIKKGQLQNVINASVLYTKYNTALDEIIKMDSNAILRPQNIDFYFNYITKNFDKDTFYEVHRFITEGASAGETKALQEVLNDTLVKKGLIDNAESKGVLDSVLHLMSKLASPNQSIEQIVRLSQHMEQLKRGMSFAESSAKIAKVHFNYADKLDATRMIEILFPFFNFKMKNFEYWVDTLTTNRWVGRMFEEYTQGVWDFDNYDTYQEHLELANNQSLQYQLMSGSIPLFDTGLRIKVNPSFMDVLQTVTDPYGTAQSSLFAPFKTAFKLCALDEYNKANVLSTIAEGIPLLGPLHQQYAKSVGDYYDERLNKQNISPIAQFFAKALPSVFTVPSRWNLENIKSPEEYAAMVEGYRQQWESNGVRYRRNYYAKQNAYKKYGKRYKQNYTRYSKRVYPRKTYPKKTYAKKTYYNTSYSRYHKYSTGNRYYNSYNPGYSKFVEYYNKPYNRYSEYSTIKASKNVKQPHYENIYWKYYTKSGKRRMDILNAKATQKNLQMKIKLMYDYYR